MELIFSHHPKQSRHISVCNRSPQVRTAKKRTKIITYASTAIVLVGLTVVGYLFNSLEPNKLQNNEQSNEHKANESPAEQKDG